MKTLKVALGQMVSTADLEGNLDKMRGLAQKAKELGAHVIAFPEIAYFTSPPETSHSVTPQYEKLKGTFSQWAKELGVYLLPGTVREPVPGKPQKSSNTALFFGPEGQCLAEYRKIFLFKANLPDRIYDESLNYEAGSKLVTVDSPWGKFGFSICFDLRFPELFRALRKQDASVVFLPAAFTVPTGKVHWKPLITARAIENQFFIVAPGQTGRSGDGAEKFGHSLVVSPWGEPLLEMKSEEGLGLAELNFDLVSEARSRVDAWASCRPDLFPFH